MEKNQTRKKVKIIGSREFIDATTGEKKEFNVIDIEERDANFHKFWMYNIICSLDLIGNQKIKFAFWLIEQMDSENKVCFTMRQMASKSGISLETVRVTIKSLISSNFLVRQNIGVYRVNPDCIFKGGKSARLRVVLDYHGASDEPVLDGIQG